MTASKQSILKTNESYDIHLNNQNINHIKINIEEDKS